MVASSASPSAAQGRVSVGLPLNRVGRPVTPSQRSPRIGWSITPSSGQPSTTNAINVPKIGRPAMKARVPSIGSSTQARPDEPGLVPYSSPMIASSGKRASISRRIAEEIGLPRDRIILSAKVSNVQDLIAVYRDLAARSDYAIHLGLTEAGMGSKGIVASSAAMGILLQDGIGDTIRRVFDEAEARRRFPELAALYPPPDDPTEDPA